MKKAIIIAILMVLNMINTTAQSPNRWKGGLSIIGNISFWDESFVPVAGVQMALDRAIFKKHSIQFALYYHYGEYPSIFDKSITSRVHLFGPQLEYRFHLRERFDGIYWGLGLDSKLLTIKNYFPPTPEDPVPTFGNLEKGIGLIIGEYIPIKESYFIDPSVYFGIGDFTNNEYVLYLQVSLFVGFHR